MLHAALGWFVPWEIALALTTAPPDMKEKILRNLLVVEERQKIEILIGNIGRVRLSDVETMRQRIVDRVADVMADGSSESESPSGRSPS